MKELKKKWKRGLAVFLAAVMLAGQIQMPVQAATGVKTMNFDMSYLAPSDGRWDAANDHKVYFGQYGGNPTAFRVLAVSSSAIMLDCDTILSGKRFDADENANDTQKSGNPNEWTGSDLESWLNGTDYYDSISTFTSVERSAIAQTSLLASEADYKPAGVTYRDYAAKDYVYLLSGKEAATLYADDTARVKTGTNDSWWLRSAAARYTDYAGFVLNGGLNFHSVGADTVGVSPALNINLLSVLFTSATGKSKSSDTLTAVTSDSTTKEWKLTLLDTSKTVKVTDGQVVTESGDIITVPYTYTGSDVNQISVMITSGAYTDANAEILYYGKLNTTLASSGTGTFTLPDGLPAGYRTYILAEDVNEEKYTDYASSPVEIPVAAPTTDLAENTYTSNQSVALASATGGADIYYTMTSDGSEPADPTTESTAYTGAISLTGTAGSSITYKIKAIAVKTGMLDSSVSSFTYTISIPGSSSGGGGGWHPSYPSEPDTPVEPEQPFIKGDDGKEGWDVITDQTETAKDGDTIIVDMNGTTTVPKDVIESIKGKDVDIVFDMGNGMTWTVNGKDITSSNLSDINFGITSGTANIPVEVINKVTGEKYSLNLNLEHNGEFGFIAVLTVNMEKKNSGLYANLFYYNEKAKKLEFVCADEIDKEGNADLTFTHASDYTIVIDKEPMGVSEAERQSARKNLSKPVKAGKNYNTLSWGKVEGADGYIIYAVQCNTKGKTYKLKKVKTITSADVTSYKHKGLKENTFYKYRISAYKLVDGEKVVIGSSVGLHSRTGSKNTSNPTAVAVEKTAFTLEKGKSAKITAKAMLSKNKAAKTHMKLKYVVVDTDVVSVSADGKITAKKTGSAAVYVVAQNGVSKKVTVTVK